MKSDSLLKVGLLCMLFTVGTANAQLKIKRPKVKVKTPSVSVGKGDKNVDSSVPASGSSTNTSSPVSKNDPSGLFKNVSDNSSAEYHRQKVVGNLQKIEQEFQKENIDYQALKRLMEESEQSLKSIKKLEPNVDSSLFYEKYNPLKDRADKQNGMYAEANELEKLFEGSFHASERTKHEDPISFGLIERSTELRECYCTYGTKRTYAEYKEKKKRYEQIVSELAGYNDTETKEKFDRMTTCQENGNKYAIWASTENIDNVVEAYNKEHKPLDPHGVIKYSDDYLNALNRISSDYSMEYGTEAATAIEKGKQRVESIKSEAERYISSGEFDAHKEKVHKDRIAKEFLPKAVRSSSGLQQGVKTFIVGAKFNEHIGNMFDLKPATKALKVNITSTGAKIKKHANGIPRWKYHSTWVAYKDADGRCYKVAVRVKYEYAGGGTYSKTPIYLADEPVEMACENVYK